MTNEKPIPYEKMIAGLTACAGAYALYQYCQEESKIEDIQETDDETPRLERSTSASKDNEFFLCPKEFLHEVVPKMMEQVPDPTSEQLAPERLVKMEYAVRGTIPIMAGKIEEEINNGSTKYPFERLLYCNIGNPIAVGHTPYTYMRQMLGAYWSRDYESLPADLGATMKSFMDGHKSGSYTNHRGTKGFLKAVTKWLDERDAPDRMSFRCAERETEVFLTDGASGGITTLMEFLMDTSATDLSVKVTHKESNPHLDVLQQNIDRFTRQSQSTKTSATSGVFCPIPQYPLYSATIRRLGGTIIPYELEEENGWSMPSMQTLESLYMNSVVNGVFPKAFVVINPGNPSGNLLSRSDLVDILHFCARYRLVLFADEVYQDNVWSDREFFPMRRIMMEEGLDVKIASFHSCSKGLYGECGVRGGFMALDNCPENMVKLVDKMCSVKLCPNVGGQCAIATVCSPPKGESKALYEKERNECMSGLQAKANMLVERLNELEGVTCNPPGGAMYAFPQIRLPKTCIEDAMNLGIAADTLYCREMLYATGIVTVPGSGFKQKKGTYHYRITILPAKDDLEEALGRLSVFHTEFLSRYQ